MAEGELPEVVLRAEPDVGAVNSARRGRES